MGISAHGEASVARYEGEIRGGQLHIGAELPCSRLRVSRVITLDDNEVFVRISESVENLSSTDRPIGWTQHVTLGPPFLEAGGTQFNIRSKRSRVFEAAGFDTGGLVRGADFGWPHAPLDGNGTTDLRLFASGTRSSSFTAHLMDRRSPEAYFVAYSPCAQVLFGYEWHRRDFPWLGIWEENKSRQLPPWRGETVACGMEFGVSPFPETREQMYERASLFGVPTFRWLKGREHFTVQYSAFIRQPHGIP